MDEDVLSRLSLDEAKSLGRIKPLHNTFFFHRNFLVKLFALLWNPPSDRAQGGRISHGSLANGSNNELQWRDVQTQFDYNTCDSAEATENVLFGSRLKQKSQPLLRSSEKRAGVMLKYSTNRLRDASGAVSFFCSM